VKEEQIEEISHQFMILQDEKQEIAAAIGYEQAGENGLLRSLIMSPAVDKSLFVQFFQTFLQKLHKKQLKKLYLITNKPISLELFHMFGFAIVDNENVHPLIQELVRYKKAKEQPNALVMECELFTELSTD
jgi:N-acetylglutamate synthase-like GNAT family acetyltransferase